MENLPTEGVSTVLQHNSSMERLEKPKCLPHKLTYFLARKIFKNWGNSYAQNFPVFQFYHQLFWMKILYQVYIHIPRDNAVATTRAEAIFSMFVSEETIC